MSVLDCVVGLEGLRMAVAGLSELILGVVLGLGDCGGGGNDSGRVSNNRSGSGNNRGSNGPGDSNGGGGSNNRSRSGNNGSGNNGSGGKSPCDGDGGGGVGVGVGGGERGVGERRGDRPGRQETGRQNRVTPNSGVDRAVAPALRDRCAACHQGANNNLKFKKLNKLDAECYSRLQ